MSLAGCLTSQQHASVPQGRTCSDKSTCCHTGIRNADQTCCLIPSKYTDSGPTSPSVDSRTPCTRQGSPLEPQSSALNALYRTTPHHTTPRHATPHHATPRHATPHHTTPRHAAPHHPTPHTIPHHIHHTTPHHNRTTPYHTTHHTIPHTTPYHTPHHTPHRTTHHTTHHTTPHTIPHHTPHHTTPYHTTPPHTHCSPKRQDPGNIIYR